MDVTWLLTGRAWMPRRGGHRSTAVLRFDDCVDDEARQAENGVALRQARQRRRVGERGHVREESREEDGVALRQAR